MEKVLDSRKLANGVVVTVTDISKPVAGDRWVVRINCEARMPLPQSVAKKIADEAGGLGEMMRGSLKDELVYCFVRERNFIDQERRKELIAEILDQIVTNTFPYLAEPEFPARYAEKCFADEREACLCKLRAKRTASDDDDEEPVDFSHCFKK